jgi:hypothetical protein
MLLEWFEWLVRGMTTFGPLLYALLAFLLVVGPLYTYAALRWLVPALERRWPPKRLPSPSVIEASRHGLAKVERMSRIGGLFSITWFGSETLTYLQLTYAFPPDTPAHVLVISLVVSLWLNIEILISFYARVGSQRSIA